MHHYSRETVLGWRKIHNSSISTFLIYLNWWSTFVAGGLSFIPMVPNACQPQTAFLFMSSWIEVFTFVMLVWQSALLSVLMNKLDTEELVNTAEKVLLIYHGISLIMPVMFLFLTNMMTEWTVEASKIILQYHFAQNLASTYYNHRTTVKYIEALGVWMATSGLCQYGDQLCMKIGNTRKLTRYRSCFTNYYLISTQIFVALSIITPFMMKLVEVIVPPGIKEPIVVKRRIEPRRSRPRRWLQWPLLTSPWKRTTSTCRYEIARRGRQLCDRPDDGQIPGPSSAC